MWRALNVGSPQEPAHRAHDAGGQQWSMLRSGARTVALHGRTLNELMHSYIIQTEEWNGQCVGKSRYLDAVWNLPMTSAVRCGGRRIKRRRVVTRLPQRAATMSKHATGDSIGWCILRLMYDSSNRRSSVARFVIIFTFCFYFQLRIMRTVSLNVLTQFHKHFTQWQFYGRTNRTLPLSYKCL